MPEVHSTLGPSSAERWLACTPSQRLCENMPDRESEVAKEGTCFHALCEFELKRALGMEAEDPRGQLEYFNTEMHTHALEYVSYALELVGRARTLFCQKPQVFIEQLVSFEDVVPQGFGTSDCIVLADGTLYILDAKYGYNPVQAKDNPQLKLYAYGAYMMFKDLYDINEVSMHIFQPRLSNVCEAQITVADLVDWAQNYVKPRAVLAFEGKGEFCSGEHCKYCRAASQCKKRAEDNLKEAKRAFSNSALLSKEEVEEILPKLEQIASWCEDVKEYALSQAINGVHYKGYKVVEGRSIRSYVDEQKAADAVKEAGFDPYEQKILSVAAMEKKLGRQVFNQTLGSLITKPKGKPCLVVESDKRQEYSFNDFSEV